jgi:hypothetical protein
VQEIKDENMIWDVYETMDKGLVIIVKKVARKWSISTWWKTTKSGKNVLNRIPKFLSKQEIHFGIFKGVLGSAPMWKPQEKL